MTKTIAVIFGIIATFGVIWLGFFVIGGHVTLHGLAEMSEIRFVISAIFFALVSLTAWTIAKRKKG